MGEIILKVLLGVFLIMLAIQDLARKKVKVWLVILGGLLICACIPFCSMISLFNRLLGLTLGLGLIILSKATGGKIGVGDGLVICVTGIGLGFWTNLELFVLALFIAAIFSIGLLAFRLADRKKSIPFLPFLFLSYLMLNVPIWG
ncbi:MAG: hypothetical protein GX237_04555 [Clostridiales bacterium]|nr:hypothetical protein [Clostridiales bacterium]